MNQPDLFARYPDYPGSVRRDTSEDAADSIAPQVGRLQSVVLDAIRAAGSRGLTDEELQSRLGLRPNTARPRRCELYLKGLVKDSGVRRATASGRTAAVWVAS